MALKEGRSLSNLINFPARLIRRYSISEIVSKFNNMRKLYQIVFFLILGIQVYSQCCIRFEGKSCIQCPKGTHVFRGNCIFDIKDCASYKDGFDCATCNPGFQLNSTGDCQVNPVPVTTSPIIPNVVSKDYTDTMIDPQNLSGPAGDTFLISDQYLRTLNQNVLSASVVGARVRSYVNGTSQTTIQYQVSPGTYYRGVLQMDLQTFVMKPISFEKATTLTLNQQTDPSPPPPSAPTMLKTEAVNLGNPAHIDKISLIDASARTQNQKITMIKSGNITSYSDGTYSLSLIYSTSTPGEEVLVSGNILQTNTAKINDVKVLAATVNMSPNTDTLDGTVKNTPPVTQSTTFQPINPQDVSDQNYLICKDFLVSQVVQCSGIDPTKAQRLVQGSKSSYVLTYTKPDGSVWDIGVSINTDSFVAQIDKQTQITGATKPITPAYVKIDNNLIFKDINFLFVDDYINKQSKDKYKSSVVRSVEKMESSGVATYRVLFEQSGFVWEVVASINVSTFVTSGFKETKKQALPPAPVTNTTASTNSSAPANSTSNNQTQISTSNTTQTPVSNATQAVSKNTTNTASSSSTVPVSSSNTTSSNFSGGNQTAPKNISSPSSPIINTTNSSTSAVSSSTTTLNIDGRSSNTSSQANHTSTTTSSTTTITPTPAFNPNNSPTTNTNTNTNANSNTNTNSNKPVPPPFLASLASGLSTLSNDDMSSGQFKQIDTLIRAVNPAELKNAVVIGAFIKTASFTRNYQIYYQSPSEIYEAVISRDQLRRRTYIISFGKLGF